MLDKPDQAAEALEKSLAVSRLLLDRFGAGRGEVISDRVAPVLLNEGMKRDPERTQPELLASDPDGI